MGTGLGERLRSLVWFTSRIGLSAGMVSSLLLSASHAAKPGDLDPAFGGAGKVVIPFVVGSSDRDRAMAIAAVPGSELILVVGEAEDYPSIGHDMAAARLRADGTLDPSFGTAGKATIAFDLGGNNNDGALAVAMRPDGRAVLAGYADWGLSDWDFAVAQLKPDGSLDPGFGTGGKVTIYFDLGAEKTDLAQAIALQPDGKAVVCGWAQNEWNGIDHNDIAVVRILADGSLDPSFAHGGRLSLALEPGAKYEDCNDLLIQPDGKIVLVGSVQRSTDQDIVIIRLDSVGSPDPGFGANGVVYVALDQGRSNSDVGWAVTLQADDKILVGATTDNGSDFDFAIVRLLATGNLDTTFSGGWTSFGFDLGTSSKDDGLFDIAMTDDGGIIVAGYADTTASIGGEDFAIARLTHNGALDSGFGSGGKVSVGFDRGGYKRDIARAVLVQPDQKIVLAGGSDNKDDDRDFALTRHISYGVFGEDFESGDTSVWTLAVP